MFGHHPCKAITGTLLTHRRTTHRLTTARWLAACKPSNGEKEKSKTFILEYTYVSDMETKRVPMRPAHLQYTETFVRNKSLIAGGALVPAIDRGEEYLVEVEVE